MRRQRRVERKREHRRRLVIMIKGRLRRMQKDAGLTPVYLFPKRFKFRRIKIAAANIGGNQDARKAQLVQRVRHFFKRELDIVEWQMRERLEAVRRRAARLRERIV